MNPFRYLFVLFIAIPLLEIYLFIKVGEVVGAWPTVFFIVLTAVIGVALLRQQGLSTLSRFQQQVQRGELPANTMAEGIMLVFSGALLLTPGFFTDAIGFLLLMPFVRRAIIGRFMRNGNIHMNMGGFTQQSSGQVYEQTDVYHKADENDHASVKVIEGEVIRKDE